MSDNNVVTAKFREPTNIEAYIEGLQLGQPKTLFSITVEEGETYFNWFGIDNVDEMLGKLERAKDLLKLLDAGLYE